MPFYVDNTMLRKFKCTMAAWLRFGQHRTVTEERAEWLAGKAAHRALAAYFRGSTREYAMGLFGVVYEDWAREHEASIDERLRFGNTQAILNQWIFTHPLDKLGVTVDPELVEIPFEAALDDHGDIIYCGRIDLVPIAHGHYTIWENKTTGRVNDYWIRQWRSDSQGSGYVYGARYGLVNGKALNLDVQDYMINAIQFSRIPDGGSTNPKCKKHGVKASECGVLHPIEDSRILGPYPRTDQMLQAWRADALGLALKLKQVIEDAPHLEDAGRMAQEGRFFGECRFCEFEESVCLTGAQPQMIAANTIVAPWEPWKEVQDHER